MPAKLTKLKRCGRCNACRSKICHPTRGNRCMGCEFPSRKEGCHLRPPCTKQAANNTHFVATTGESTSASESESTSRHRYPTRLSISDNETNAGESTATALDVIGNIVSNLDHFTIDDITRNVQTGVSSTPVGDGSEFDSSEQTLIKTEVLPKQTNPQSINLPHYQSN